MSALDNNPPKAEATGSNPVGCANNSNQLGYNAHSLMSRVATMSPPDKISTIHAPLKLERMASASSRQTLSSKLRAMGFRKLPGPAAPGSSARDNSWSNSSIARLVTGRNRYPHRRIIDAPFRTREILQRACCGRATPNCRRSTAIPPRPLLVGEKAPTTYSWSRPARHRRAWLRRPSLRFPETVARPPIRTIE
jgi:hypothetical protein